MRVVIQTRERKGGEPRANREGRARVRWTIDLAQGILSARACALIVAIHLDQMILFGELSL